MDIFSKQPTDIKKMDLVQMIFTPKDKVVQMILNPKDNIKP